MKRYRNISLAYSVGLGTIALVFAVLAWAQTVDQGKSKVTVTFKQMNVPVDAAFKNFKVHVSFDATKLAETKATVEIDTASFDLGPGTEDYNAEVRKKEWFDTKSFPKAIFQTNGAAKSLGAGKYEVPGKLTLKGKTVELLAPVSVKTEGASSIFEGQVPIKRLAFNIGDGEWKDTATVADEVVIKFRIVTTN